MVKILSRLLVVCTLTCVFSGNCSPQARNGVPPFGSAAGGPDTINLANLNADISVPIRSKAGRGTNFTYALNYDSLIWTPVTSGGTQSWQPSSQWGWSGLQPAGSSHVSYSVVNTSGQCGFQGQSSYQEWIYSNFWYYDNFGVWHQFPIEGDYFSSPGGGTCPPNGPQPTTPMSSLASDGSGYTLTVTMGNSGQGQPSAYVTDKNGAFFNIPVGTTPPSSGNTSTVDRNGNMISQANGVYTDTLGTTALSLVSSFPTSTTFSYAAPAGATASYVVSYKGYIVKTAFGCSVTEYDSGTTQISLVDKITLPDGSFYQFAYEPTLGFPGDVTGRIASVIFPTGGQIVYGYAGGSSGHITCATGTPATLTRQTPDGTWTYALTAGTGSASTTTITDPTLPTGNQTIIQFQGAYETQRKVYQGSTSGTLLQTIDTCFNISASPCTAISIALPITQTSRILTLPGGLQSKLVNTYNSSGMLTETDSYDYGSGAPPASPLKKTIISYAALSGIASMPATVTVQDGGGTVQAQTTYTYDQGSVTATSGTPQHVAVGSSRGNATTISQLVQGGTTLNSTATYYDTGTIKTSTDVNGAVTTLNYSNATATCGNAFATSVSEPLSLTKSMTWNCAGAIVTQITDENGNNTTNTYNDPFFWRPASVTDPTAAAINFSYATSAPYTWTESKLSFNSGNSAVDVLTTFDGLGRIHLKQKRQGPTASNYDTVETDYDSSGRVSRVTLPYSGTAGQTSSTAPGTSISYDALNRPLTSTDGGGGTTTNSYSQNDILVTMGPAPSGENTKQRQLEYNGLNQLTSVCELTSVSGSGFCWQNSSGQIGYWTKYSYSTLGNIAGVTQNAQAGNVKLQTRTFAYDDLGRLTSETNPESGTTSYAYDTAAGCTGTFAGDLIERLDAVGNTICSSYDVLHRKLSTTYSGPYSGVTPNKYFVYDTATVNSVVMVNAKARLAEAYTATTQGGAKITDLGFSYSSRGEVSDTYESTPHSGAYYHLTQTYWANGLPSVLSGVPGLPTINYGGTIGSTVGLDGEGRITQVTASSGQNPLPGTTYNVFGSPGTINFGSNDSDVFTYDPNSARMTQYKFNVNAQSDTGTLTWNTNGTLKTLVISDALNSADTQSCSYSFDDLKRVTSANCGSAWSQTFGYDAFGNITKNGSISFKPIYKNPITLKTSNRFVSIPGTIVSYDANGNVSNDGAHTYSWDAEARPVTIDGVNMTYDALARMVEQNRSGSYTELIYSPTGDKLAFMTGQTLQKARVKLPGNASAVYTSAGLSYYRHPDWLGSIRLGSTTARAMYSDVAYAPFGEPYAQAGATDYSFAGMDQDSVGGDYDAAAREYSTQGRWPSPDPSGSRFARVAFPQTWNRYAYSLNNPLSLLDPSGLDCVYLNDSGSAAEFVDTSSNAGECGNNGGYWIPGTVDKSSIKVYSDTGWITAQSNAGLGLFASPCTGFGCGSNVSDANTLMPNAPSAFGKSGIPTASNSNWAWADPNTGMPSTPVPTNAQSAAQQLNNSMDDYDRQLYHLGQLLSQPFMNPQQGCLTASGMAAGTAALVTPGAGAAAIDWAIYGGNLGLGGAEWACGLL